MDDANRIKNRLKSCASIAEIMTVADEERAAVVAMGKKGGNDKVMAIQIANLKSYLIDRFNGFPNSKGPK